MIWSSVVWVIWILTLCPLFSRPISENVRIACFDLLLNHVSNNKKTAVPDNVLTRKLSPIFEAAVAAEKDATPDEPPSMSSPMKRMGPGLPSSPRAATGMMPALRKPPSLSTLAMPNMSAAKPPSEQLLKALRGLIAQLPPANRDLLKTLTELIMLTAANSAKTKMPLHNLLLVFCPSVSMNPSLLRTLCEAPQFVWDGVRAQSRTSMRDEEERGQETNVEGQTEGRQEDVARLGNVEPRQGNRRHVRDLSTPAMLASSSSTSSSSSSAMAASPLVGRSRAMTTGLRQARATMSSVYLDALENPIVSRSNSSATTDTGNSLYLSMPQTPAGGSGSRTPSTPSSAHPMTPPPELALSGSLPLPSSSSTSSPSDGDDDGDNRCSLPPVPFRTTGSVPSLPAMLAQYQSQQQQQQHRHQRYHHLHHERAPSTPARLVLGGGAGVALPPASPGGHSLPQTPISRRKSMSFLSSLSGRSGDAPSSPTGSNNTRGTNSPAPSARALRMKKPSLTLLFNKHSQSSLGSSSLNISAPSPYAGPPLDMTMNPLSLSLASPRSPPLSPASDRFSHPPRLETPIDSTPFTFDMSSDADKQDGKEEDEDEDEESSLDLPPVSSASTVKQQAWRDLSAANNGATTAAMARARAATVSGTPIADHYSASRAGSTLSLASTLDAAATTTAATPDGDDDDEQQREPPLYRRLTLARAQSHAGLATMSVDRLGLSGLGLDDPMEEDWARSVLIAADADAWRMNGPVA
jgi:hypothetical protein